MDARLTKSGKVKLSLEEYEYIEIQEKLLEIERAGLTSYKPQERLLYLLSIEILEKFSSVKPKDAITLTKAQALALCLITGNSMYQYKLYALALT
ncbi:MAG: hypothetical protein KatS3mg101_1174 [Patescibacteria group bacterium]|nr:MAG: hypothetical protein KatS3mg101_1174 [Patescibacteria group bacterium]